jgi:uncharacterized membrane protein
MNIFKFDEPIDLSKHMLATYQTLRVVLFIIALLFPWVLWIGGAISQDHLELQGSMSAYYHANEASDREFAERQAARREQRERKDVQLDSGRGVMRNWFVGGLFAISALLAVYKGFRPAEDLALNLAGVFAALVALLPMAWDEPGLPLHGIFAIGFFLCIAYVCIFCASATLPLVKEGRRAVYRRLYKLLGYAMVASPVSACILTWVLGFRSSYLFFAEACGVYAFAAYWLVKTIEIRETNADRWAASGELQLAAGTGLSDAISEIPVTRAGRPDAEVTERETIKP